MARRGNSCEAKAEAVGKDSLGGKGSEGLKITNHQPRQQEDDGDGENQLLGWD